MSLRRLAPASFLAVGVLTLAACGAGNPSADSGSGQASGLQVVTSTNVYADIVSTIAGDAVTVTPIISDANQDPHSYEATTQDQLTLSEADLVVENGGGYDAFITTMLEAIDEEPHVIDAVSLSGLPGSEDLGNEPHEHDHEGHDHAEEEGAEDHAHDHEGHDHSEEEGAEDHAHDHEGHDHGEFNEHVWYSVPTMVKVVDEVESELSELVPEQAETFTKNADTLRSDLEGLTRDIEEVHELAEGKKSAATEPVPLWLFEDMGLDTITPPEFLAALEEGNDVSPAVMQEAQEQVENKEVAILAYNTQATNDQAEALKAAAEEAGIPVVDMSETLPENTSYIDWMSGYVSDVKNALS